jgi:RNA polymerase sigma-70 factor (ECF subfamily)
VGKSGSDAELIKRAQAGEVDAYGELYQRYVDIIFRYLRTRVPDEQTAEDLTETVFLRAFDRLDGYKDRGHPFSTYLYRAARNQLVDFYRAQKHEAELDQAEDIESSEMGPEAQLDQTDRRQQLQVALDQLPADYQEVIQLRILLELPTPTVAQWMERSEGATRVLLHRALKSMKDLLETQDG